VPRIGYHLPCGVTAEEIKGIIIVELTDRQTGNWPLKYSRYDLSAVPRMPMTFVDWAEANDRATADASRHSFPYFAQSAGSFFNHWVIDSPSPDGTARRITEDAMLIWPEAEAKEHILNSFDTSIDLVQML